MKMTFIPVMLLAALLCSTAARAVDYVSVGASSAVLFDAPSLKAKKLFVVNRYMPFEQVVVLDAWVKVRDRSGGLYWLEKRALGNKHFVYATVPLLDVLAQPDTVAAKVFQVRQHVALELLDSTGTGWLKVRHTDGDIGYVRSGDVWGG